MLVNIDKLEETSFDWCFSCAKFHCANNNVRMFAYIFLSLIRMMPKDEYWFDETEGKDGRTNGFKFTIRLSRFLENDAIRTELFKKKNWKDWLPELIRNHILMYDHTITETTLKSIKKPAKIEISDDRIEVIYVYKD